MLNFKTITLLGTWFGAGKSPKAAGTVGSLAALPFAWGIESLVGSFGLLLAALALFPLGCWVCEMYVKETGKTDPSELVIDEVVALWMVLSFLPFHPIGYAIGFILFRFFDVLKPWPISWFDKNIKGGVGVMLDDVIAAAFSVIIGLGGISFYASYATTP